MMDGFDKTKFHNQTEKESRMKAKNRVKNNIILYYIKPFFFGPFTFSFLFGTALDAFYFVFCSLFPERSISSTEALVRSVFLISLYLPRRKGA
jgi:hypothetical protein